MKLKFSLDNNRAKTTETVSYDLTGKNDEKAEQHKNIAMEK